MGHLAACEATSSLPRGKIADGMRRLGLDDAARYFDEHVEADAVHEQVAIHDSAVPLVAEEPLLRLQVLSGVALCLSVDEIVAEETLARGRRSEERVLSTGADVA